MLLCVLPFAHAGHPARPAAPNAALDKFFRKVRLEFMRVVPNEVSDRVHQRAGPEKERSQIRTGNLSENTLQNLEMVRVDVRRCKSSQTADV
jgi:hypothetical protein